MVTQRILADPEQFREEPAKENSHLGNDSQNALPRN